MPAETRTTVRELRQHLSDHLRRVVGGGTVLVTSRGEPVARLVPVAPAKAEPRPFGFMRGQIRMAPDFDETPTDVLTAIEADPYPSRRPRRR
jgi:prevent-host-death family protein